MWVWLALAGPILLTVDAVMGFAYRTNTNADVKVIFAPSLRTIRS
jgi:hypothetical protein